MRDKQPTSKTRLRLVLFVIFVIALGLVLLRYMKKDDVVEEPSATTPLISGGMSTNINDIAGAIARVEQSKQVNEQVKKQLVEQGYPEAAVDSLLAQGAQRAIALQNIAAVEKNYGTPWNIRLYAGDYELVALYLVGNDEENRFVLGQYEDSTGEHVIFMHMSTTAPIETLQAGLVYSSEQSLEYATAYLNDRGDIVGFRFDVELADGKGIARYVATSSGVITQEDIASFISAVVDGTLV